MDFSETFISEIKANNLRNIGQLTIPLNKSERNHLILTGKNGCGKTTLLLEINKFLTTLFNNQFQNIESQKANEITFTNQVQQLEAQGIPVSDRRLMQAKNQITNIATWREKQVGNLEVDVAHSHDIQQQVNEGKFLIAFFDAKRTTQMNNPNGINKVNLKAKYNPTEKANQSFIQYIVNMKAERSFARDDGDDKEVKRIEKWFISFENRLKDIFQAPSLKLVFDRKNYNFHITIDGKEPFTLAQLSDGHSAIISLITELILRMELIDSGNYKLPGVVLIDEIETHLYVDLQKKILPFLSDFFPNIQFIVTTHSPFVLSSISDSIICDLQTKTITSDLSGYSYDALIESYFSSDKYSAVLQEKISRYEELSTPSSDKGNEEYLELEKYFSCLPKYLSAELNVKLQQIELSKLKATK